MLIASRFQRPDAPVELPNADGTWTTYFFRPIDPRNPTSEHVAHVTDPDHISRLLAIREGYYLSQAEQTLKGASTKVAKPVASPPGPAAAAPAAPPAEQPPRDGPATAEAADAETGGSPSDAAPESAPADGEPEPEAEADGAAKELLALGLRAFRAAVKKAPRPVLERALEIEMACGEDERATFTKALKAALAK